MITQRLVLTRGDARDITLTMPAGSDLTLAHGIRFTARNGADEIVWEQEDITPESDTVAVAHIGASDWDEDVWSVCAYPSTVTFDFEVTNEDDEPHTVARGIITVIGDDSR